MRHKVTRGFVAPQFAMLTDAEAIGCPVWVLDGAEWHNPDPYVLDYWVWMSRWYRWAQSEAQTERRKHPEFVEP